MGLNDTPSALVPVDPGIVAALTAPQAAAPIDPESAGTGSLPADHPAWQRDVVSISARARAIVATIVPTVVRVLTFWDHRLRELALGSRTLCVDPAGCYRLR